jgi:heat shock protein HtpX
MNFRQGRTLLASLILLAIYFAPVWGVISLFEITDLRLIGAGHAVIILILLSQYVAGVRNSKQAVNAQPLAAGEDVDDIDEHSASAQILRETERLSDELGVDTPAVYVGDFGVLNAFVTGRRNNGTIVLSRSLIERLPLPHLRVVIAHELSHLKSHDTTLMMLGEGLDKHLQTAKYSAIGSIRTASMALVMKPFILVFAVLRLIVLLPLRFVSRRREFVADRDAAQVCGAETTAITLRTISQANSNISPPPRAQAVDALCIDGTLTSIIERLFGTHPKMKSRIDRLED